jgi:hypothetical protein
MSYNEGVKSTIGGNDKLDWSAPRGAGAYFYRAQKRGASSLHSALKNRHNGFNLLSPLPTLPFLVGILLMSYLAPKGFFKAARKFAAPMRMCLKTYY